MSTRGVRVKPWWASKTVWTSVVALVAAVGTIAGLDLGLAPEAQAEIVAAVVAVANLALRFVTASRIGR